jgi:P27 family predicted phage terminase small subunit
MAMGRTPLPTALKLVKGTLRKDRRNKNEPQPARALSAEPPEHLTEKQKEVWRYVIDNAPSGLLKSLDWAVLEIWVVSYTVYRDSQEAVNRIGQVIKTPNDYPVVNPYLSNMNKQAQIMLKAASEMGFTPASRSRIVVGQENEADDPWSKLALNGD